MGGHKNQLFHIKANDKSWFYQYLRPMGVAITIVIVTALIITIESGYYKVFFNDGFFQAKKSFR